MAEKVPGKALERRVSLESNEKNFLTLSGQLGLVQGEHHHSY